MPGAALQSDRGGVNRLLPERAKALSLKDPFRVADLAGVEEGLEAIVRRSGEDHAAQDFAPLAGGERRFDRGATKKSVAVVEQLFASLRQSSVGRHPGSRLGQAIGEQRRMEA